MKKIALYDPYLNILGGGERYVLSILKVFENNGFDVFVFSDSQVNSGIKNKLGLNFRSLRFLPNIFQNNSPVEKLANLKQYDYFLYVTDGSYFFSSAKKNYIYAMVPKQSLYSKTFIDRLKRCNFTFITHSRFTQDRLNSWGIQTKLLYPYTDMPKTVQVLKKEKIILSIGRFFKHLHSKRHDLAIQAFKRLKRNTAFRDFKLIIAGGLQKEDQPYLEELKLLAKDSTIELLPNVPYTKLVEYYKKSLFYWHFAGFGIDENTHPELVEHMGISPIEAMASGSIPFCYSAGGPKEIISQGENGFLFHSEDELIKQMRNLTMNSAKILSMQKQGIEFSQHNFSYSVFEKNVIKLFQL